MPSPSKSYEEWALFNAAYDLNKPFWVLCRGNGLFLSINIVRNGLVESLIGFIHLRSGSTSTTGSAGFQLLALLHFAVRFCLSVVVFA